MNQERKIKILKGALTTILAETKEPIIKVYAQSALDETKDIEEIKPPANSQCKKHNWFGLLNEKCPICAKSTQ